jgi:hypothetical protein
MQSGALPVSAVRQAAVPITLALQTGPVFVISTEVEKSFALNLSRFARQSKRCLDSARHDKVGALQVLTREPSTASLPIQPRI